MIFQRLHLSLYPETGWRIQWHIEGITNDDTIIVQRGSSQLGPWEDIASLESHIVFYTDTVPNFRGFFSNLYYRLIVKDVDDNEKGISAPFNGEKYGNRIVNEIVRQHELLLNGTNSHPGYMSRRFACYKKTRFGTPCTACLHVDTREVMVDNCKICGGSRTLEGWSNPAVFYGRWLSPVMKQTSITPTTEAEMNNKQLFLSNYPVIDPTDILIEEDGNHAWQISSVTATQPGGFLASQQLTVSQIDPQQIQAKLKFPEES